jgi:hypothetical protein
MRVAIGIEGGLFNAVIIWTTTLAAIINRKSKRPFSPPIGASFSPEIRGDLDGILSSRSRSYAILSKDLILDLPRAAPAARRLRPGLLRHSG